MAQTGTPRTKFLVPSIGSTTHWRWLWPVEPCSSPSTASRDRTRDEGAADGLLDGLVGVGDRRQVGLAHHVQVECLEAVVGDRVGVVGEHVGQAQVVGVVDPSGELPDAGPEIGMGLRLWCRRTELPVHPYDEA